MTRSIHIFAAIVLLLPPGSALAQDGELAKVKEQELAEVRERISALKQSMDERAAARDRLTAELQKAEVLIAESASATSAPGARPNSTPTSRPGSRTSIAR